MERRKFIKQTSAAAALTTLLPAGALGSPRFPQDELKQHICIFSKHLHWLGYRDMARLASEIGFTGIDLTVRKDGHVLPERVKQDLPIAVEQIRAEGLEVPMITTGITDPTDQLTKGYTGDCRKAGNWNLQDRVVLLSQRCSGLLSPDAGQQTAYSASVESIGPTTLLHPTRTTRDSQWVVQAGTC